MLNKKCNSKVRDFFDKDKEIIKEKADNLGKDKDNDLQ